MSPIITSSRFTMLQLISHDLSARRVRAAQTNPFSCDHADCCVCVYFCNTIKYMANGNNTLLSGDANSLCCTAAQITTSRIRAIASSSNCNKPPRGVLQTVQLLYNVNIPNIYIYMCVYKCEYITSIYIYMSVYSERFTKLLQNAIRRTTICVFKCRFV